MYLVWYCPSRLCLQLLSQLVLVYSKPVQEICLRLTLQVTRMFEITTNTRPERPFYSPRLPVLWRKETYRYKTGRARMLSWTSSSVEWGKRWVRRENPDIRLMGRTSNTDSNSPYSFVIWSCWKDDCVRGHSTKKLGFIKTCFFRWCAKLSMHS